MKRFLVSCLSAFLFVGLLGFGWFSPKAHGGFYEVSDAEKAYNEANKISISDCEKKSNGNYSYNSKQFNDGLNIPISKSDCGSYTLSYKFIERRALYNSWTRIANGVIKDWKNEKSYELTIIKATIGIVDGESRPSRLERLDNFCKLFPPEIDKDELLNRLDENGIISNLSTKENVEFDIEDIAEAAENAGISQRMLGYIIVYLDGIAKFQENSVHVTLFKSRGG